MSYLQRNGCGLVGLLETKIQPHNFSKLYTNVLQGWCVVSNINIHKGGIIVILWLDSHFHVNVRLNTPQCIHISVRNISFSFDFECTFVYAFNDSKGRMQLWEDLRTIKNQIKGPWIITRDFNCPLFKEDRIGSEIHFSEIDDFNKCMMDCDLSDLNYVGCRYTWSNNQGGKGRVMSKIDRSLINAEWIDIIICLTRKLTISLQTAQTTALSSYT